MIVRNHGETALVLARPAVRLRRRGVTVFFCGSLPAAILPKVPHFRAFPWGEAARESQTRQGLGEGYDQNRQSPGAR